MSQSANITNQDLPKVVLLVEDDRSLRRYLEIALQRSGYKVVTAKDGLEAMKLALASPVDVVITDAIMPNLSGQELARLLRQNPKLGSLPIILLTGQPNRNAAANDGSIDVILTKPVKTEALIECLDNLLTA
jgi:CheY-like chemotaxis protein